MVNGIGWDSVPQYVQIHHLLNGKNQKNHAGKRKGTKETEAAGGSRGRTAVPPPPRAARGGL